MTSPANGRHRQPETYDTAGLFLALQSSVGELAQRQIERGNKIESIEEELASAIRHGKERARQIETLQAEVNRLKALVAIHHPDSSAGGSRPVLRVIRGGEGPMIIAFDWAWLRERLWRPKLRVAWGAAFAAIVLLVAVQLAAGGSGSSPGHHVAAAPQKRESKIVDTTTYVPRPVAEDHLTTLLQRWTHLRSWLRRHGVSAPPALLALPADVFNMPVTHIKVVVADPDPDPAPIGPVPAISPSPDFTSPSPTATPTINPVSNPVPSDVGTPSP